MKPETYCKTVLFNRNKAYKDGISIGDIKKILNEHYKQGVDWTVSLDYYWSSDNVDIWFFNEDAFYLFVLSFGEYCSGSNGTCSIKK